MKKKIDVFEYTGQILNGVKSGVLITSKSDERVNSMTISWGMLGIEWGKPVFITVIREGRFTRELLEQNGEFTVNIPLDDSQKKALGFCGSKSGRDVNKLKELGLTLEEPESIFPFQELKSFLLHWSAGLSTNRSRILMQWKKKL